MGYKFEHSDWAATDGWIKSSERLPDMGEEVWVARWLTGIHMKYEVLKDQMLNPSIFLRDASSHGLTFYWQPVVGASAPASPPLPDSLPEAWAEQYLTWLNRDEERALANTMEIVRRLQARLEE